MVNSEKKTYVWCEWRGRTLENSINNDGNNSEKPRKFDLKKLCWINKQITNHFGATHWLKWFIEMCLTVHSVQFIIYNKLYRPTVFIVSMQIILWIFAIAYINSWVLISCKVKNSLSFSLYFCVFGWIHEKRVKEGTGWGR